MIPEKWCVKRTIENSEVLNEWNNTHPLYKQHQRSEAFSICNDDLFYSDRPHCKELKPGYTLITFEQFKQFILKQQPMKKQYITRANLLKLYHGNSCGEWKSFIEKYLKLTLYQTDSFEVEINDADIETAIQRADKVQKELILAAGINLIQDKSVDVTELTTCNGKSSSKTNPIVKRIYGILANKSFLLSPDYNWEMRKDDRDALCLIPTKK